MLAPRHCSILVLLLPLACYSEFDAPKRQRTPARAPARPQPRPEQGGQKKERPDEPRQSYRQAWELICHAEQRAGIDPALGRQERGTRVASWLVEKLTNKDARYWLIRFGDTQEQTKRRAMLRAEVKKLGIEHCPLQELLFAPSAPASSPDAVSPD